MSLTIFVWDPSGESKVGHASVSIESPKTYISWWPEAAGLFSPSSPGIKMARISTDTRFESRPPDFASAPITGLNEKAIIEEWDKLKGTKIDFGLGAVQRSPTKTAPDGKPDTYHLYLNNCSTVVLRCLEAGGLYTVFPNAKLSFNGVVVEPSDIKRLANEITNYAGGDVGSFSFMEHFKRQVVPWF